MDTLTTYTFPGNIRELENIISRLYIFETGTIDEGKLPRSIIEKNTIARTWNYKEVEKQLIIDALNFFDHNRSKTAEAIGWAYNRLNTKIKDYKI